MPPNQHIENTTAAKSGFTETVKTLAQFGADLDLSDVGKAPPVYGAAYQGHIDTVTALAEPDSSAFCVLCGGGLPREKWYPPFR